jgi:hypothetical protein
VTNKFGIIDNGNPKEFHSLNPHEQQKILDSKLLIYECEGTETEIKEWFKTINIAGVPLNTQELLNSIYSGPFVTKAKAEFSNSQNANMQKWSSYIKGDPKRQEILETALKWVSAAQGTTVEAYLAKHRADSGINELRTYFNSVIDWVGSVFTRSPDKEMRGLEWGRLYEEHHLKAYNAAQVDADVSALRGDPAVHSSKGIYEYVLGGKKDHKLLSIRVFDEKTKATRYEQQTKDAKAKGVSNCPLCAVGDNANKDRIYKLSEMDADHVAAWSKGGQTDLKNCELLCITHNRAKGNR